MASVAGLCLQASPIECMEGAARWATRPVIEPWVAKGCDNDGM